MYLFSTSNILCSIALLFTKFDVQFERAQLVAPLFAVFVENCCRNRYTYAFVLSVDIASHSLACARDLLGIVLMYYGYFSVFLLSCQLDYTTPGVHCSKLCRLPYESSSFLRNLRATYFPLDVCDANFLASLLVVVVPLAVR